MSWIILNSEAQLDKLNRDSADRPQVIFKHSITCSISAMIKNRLDKSLFPASMDFYYLDLINNRQISNQIAEMYKIRHESPQILLIKNGECVYTESHGAINMDDIIAHVNNK
jgi:bacillithiol system protein YtxJ